MLESQIRGPAQNPQIGENDPKWVQNGRQVLRIGPCESYGCSGAFGTGLPLHNFWGVLGRGTGRKRLGSTVGFIWADSQDLATILDPLRTIFADLGPDRLSET